MIAALIILIFFIPYTASGFKAVGTLFNSLFGWDYRIMMIFGALIVFLYTMVGGYLSVVATDFVQGCLMFFALVVVFFGSITMAGGVENTAAFLSDIPGYLSMTSMSTPVTVDGYSLSEAKAMVANGCKFLCEAANMPTTNEAIDYFKENGVIVGPSKAANAGGVACSCIEMSQNAEHTIFTEDDVFEKLEAIMVNIFKQSVAACEKYNLGDDLIAGANIAGFERVANAMLMQGIV